MALKSPNYRYEDLASAINAEEVRTFLQKTGEDLVSITDALKRGSPYTVKVVCTITELDPNAVKWRKLDV